MGHDRKREKSQAGQKFIRLSPPLVRGIKGRNLADLINLHFNIFHLLQSHFERGGIGDFLVRRQNVLVAEDGS